MELEIKTQEEREKLTKEVQQVYDKFGHVLLEAATGSGKTLQAIKLIKPGERWVIFVPKLVLIDNWKEEFKKHGYEHLLEKVDIVAYASAEKYAGTGRKRNVILDEAHHVNERRYIAIKDILNLGPVKKGSGRGHVVALSGSIEEERRYLLHNLGITEDCTVKFTTDQAVDASIVSDYKVLVVRLPLDDVKQQPLRYNKWQKTYNLTEKQAYEQLDRKYKNALENGLDTTWITLDRMKFLYDLPSKFQAAKLILGQLNLDRRILTFGSSIDQIERLCKHTHHSKKSKKDTTFEDFKTGKINRLGAITTIAEGVNVPNLDTGFVVQAMSKSLHMIQRLGRMLRVDKDNPNKKATLIVLAIEETQDWKWVNKALAYFDKNKIHHTTISEVKNFGIEKILANL